VVALSLALFYVMGRYRLPALPGLWVLAAGLLVSLREARRRPLGLALAAAAIGLGQIPLRATETGAEGWASTSSVERGLARSAGSAEEARAHRDAAVQDARRALQLAPAFAEVRVALIYALDLRTPLLEPRSAEAFDEAWRLLLVMEAERCGGALDAGVLAGDLAGVQRAAVALRAQPSRPGGDTRVAVTLSLACRRVAQDLRQPRELPLALDLLDEALRLRPEDTDTISQRGLVLQRLGRMPEAEAAYRDALSRGVDNVSLHFNLGLLLLDTGRASQAVTEFERAQQLDPGNPSVAQALTRARAAH
jgi:Flp pilus assembly protein TadD